ncbi:MAG TPA: FecR domain-containing protein [Gemmatimonadaceae bacterium]|jgi:ferric-dicitrate binding protein FerR (iron transport regulator)|nr:FecR domain-containing protein [Gemmatimonadaceae bacterium]
MPTPNTPPAETWPDADWFALAAYLDRDPDPSVVLHTEHRLATELAFARLAAPILAGFATPLPVVQTDKAAAWAAIQRRIAARTADTTPAPVARPIRLTTPPAATTSSFLRRHQRAVICTTLAASVCFMALNILSYEHDRAPGHFITQYIAAAAPRTIQLADQSTVTLTPGSTLITDSTGHPHARTVYLNGTGDFSVHADPAHPFIVKTHDVTAIALGTTFQVAVQDRASGGASHIHIGVTTGKVEVQRTGQDDHQQTLAVLGPGQETSVQTFERHFLAGWAAAAARKTVAQAYYEAKAMQAEDDRRDSLRNADHRQH